MNKVPTDDSQVFRFYVICEVSSSMGHTVYVVKKPCHHCDHTISVSSHPVAFIPWPQESGTNDIFNYLEPTGLTTSGQTTTTLFEHNPIDQTTFAQPDFLHTTAPTADLSLQVTASQFVPLSHQSHSSDQPLRHPTLKGPGIASENFQDTGLNVATQQNIAADFSHWPGQLPKSEMATHPLMAQNTPNIGGPSNHANHSRISRRNVSSVRTTPLQLIDTPLPPHMAQLPKRRSSMLKPYERIQRPKTPAPWKPLSEQVFVPQIRDRRTGRGELDKGKRKAEPGDDI